jgi:dimethylhistidine N-methyltransferase
MTADAAVLCRPDTPRANDSISAIDREEIIRGLSSPQKRLPSRLFYDAEGSALFDRICELPEYYLTRTEASIMQTSVGEMVTALGSGIRLVEFGSGSSSKTRHLLDRLDIASYVPVDISGEHLLSSAERLGRIYPGIPIQPLIADFTRLSKLPNAPSATQASPRSTAVYFPGSTLGNFEPDAAATLLRNIRKLVGDDGGLLIGADLQKDQQVLEAAYNDSAGVTAAFNLNLLHRLVRDCEAKIDIAAFEHRAWYHAAKGRIEMHLLAIRPTQLEIFGRSFRLAKGETVHTENSCKYSMAGLAALAAASDFAVSRSWSDAESRFVVQWWKAQPAGYASA